MSDKHVIAGKISERPKPIKLSAIKSKKQISDLYDCSLKYLEHIERQYQTSKGKTKEQYKRERKDFHAKKSMLERALEAKEKELTIINPQNKELRIRIQELDIELHETDRAYEITCDSFKKVVKELEAYKKNSYKNISSNPWAKAAIGLGTLAAGSLAYIVIDKFF